MTRPSLRALEAGDPAVGGFLASAAQWTAELAVLGTPQADLLHGSADHERIDGREGIDTLRVPGPSTMHHSIARQTDGSHILQSTDGGRDTLVDVERLRFDDRNVALDLLSVDATPEHLGEGSQAGLALRLLTAVAGAARALEPGVLGEIIHHVDAIGAATMAQRVVAEGTVAVLAGGASDEALVRLLYTNIVGQAPSAEALQWHLEFMHQQQWSQAQTLVFAAQLEVTAERIDLAGPAQTGVAYLEWGA